MIVLVDVSVERANEIVKRLYETSDLQGAKLNYEMVPAFPAEGRRGGYDLSSCTLGWPVQKADNHSVRGIATAGHCSDYQQWRNFSDGIWKYTVFKNDTTGATADVQWHTLDPGLSLEAVFYAASETTFLDITGTMAREDQLPGYPVCHRGKATQYSCGTITSNDFAPVYDPPSVACSDAADQICDNVFVRVSSQALRCQKGDSGGGWFSGATAYGIYMGQSATPGTSAADCYYAFYTPVRKLSIFGLQVMTK